MSNLSPIYLKDFYKTDHLRQYPEGTTKVYSNFTPRFSRIQNTDRVVVFGIQYLIRKYLIEDFNTLFFNVEKCKAVKDYAHFMDVALGVGSIDVSHLNKLHSLGYLPVHIKALPEGTLCPIGTPVLTITNTHEGFSWMPNFLETLISNVLWHPMTVATLAHNFKKELTYHSSKSSDNCDHIPYQAHDFSMRGQTSIESSMVSGAAHLLSFRGTDTIPSIHFLKKYYDATDEQLSFASVPATEHSVMCMGGRLGELRTFRTLITKTYPKGIVSIVSDTWDYWKVLKEYLPLLKDDIMNRDGTVVIRPDSGNPFDIICGQEDEKGSMEILWDLFGGIINSKGFKVLTSKVGLIYGDSITIDKIKEICHGLVNKGFDPSRVVFGIGSYSYQHVTRDTFGFAMKATYYERGKGNHFEIYKDPKTDNGIKKSARGLLYVDEKLNLHDRVSKEKEREGNLISVFESGRVINETSLAEIRQRLSTRGGNVWP